MIHGADRERIEKLHAVHDAVQKSYQDDQLADPDVFLFTDAVKKTPGVLPLTVVSLTAPALQTELAQEVSASVTKALVKQSFDLAITPDKENSVIGVSGIELGPEIIGAPSLAAYPDFIEVVARRAAIIATERILTTLQEGESDLLRIMALPKDVAQFLSIGRARVSKGEMLQFGTRVTGLRMGLVHNETDDTRSLYFAMFKVSSRPPQQG